jgi:2-oxoglutarate ferredoxin oxidoreductase subunit alpha
VDYSIKIGGEAGRYSDHRRYPCEGIFTGRIHVFTTDYESRIRGGHNFFQIRFSDTPIMASRDRIDIIVALDKESILFHEKELTDNGLIIYDSSFLKQKHEKSNFLDIPFVSLAVEHGGSKIMANTVATGAVLGMLRLSLDILTGIIEFTFRKKGEEIIKANIGAARSGYDFAVKQCLKCSFSVASFSKPLMLIAGVDAIALGAIASGCKFYSAYPMTPSTGIMNYLAGKEKEYGCCGTGRG